MNLLSAEAVEMLRQAQHDELHQLPMEKEVGSYTVEDAFNITGRGWVLAGTLTGEARSGNYLAFPSGLVVRIKGIELLNIRNQHEEISLLIEATFASRQELLDQQLIGATARVLE